MPQHVLIATLGAEPQVVTLTLDLLRRKGCPITEVIVVHTVGKAVHPALTRLAREFAQPGACKYRAVPIECADLSVADFHTETDTAALLRILYRTVLTEKRAGRLVHLSIAGGRKPMAVYGMVVAQLLFDEDDCLWHLLSEDWRPGDEQVMHVRPGDRISLIPIPVLRWSTVAPALTELALREDPWEAIQTQRSLQQAEAYRHKREFIEYVLTPAEQKLVRLVCRGFDNAALARQLHKSEKTVANQLTSVYEKLHEWRGFRDDVVVSRNLLIAEFATYFATERKKE
ncbi:MAG TPA: CRISPR-associated ring nuclease [Methylomirabilota bacterium]|jgi:CRISPR-associated protein Csx14|nr:CRISPR-associated ring nuclease [Methylomirabilota bacterium]